MHIQFCHAAMATLLGLTLTGCSSFPQQHDAQSPLMIASQGSFAVGGTVVRQAGTFDPIQQGAYNPAGPMSAGQSLHGEHAYVFYQHPVNSRKLPLVFWHGYGQSSKTWESTPDGREGFQNLFLRRDFSVYLIDQPYRAKAGKGIQAGKVSAAPDEQLWFGIFRLGVWPDFYKDVQFSKDPHALEQFFRQATPDTATVNANVHVNAVKSLFDRIGNGILVTHSASGNLGWKTAMRSKNIKAIVSYEPGGNFIFPDGETVAPMQLYGQQIAFETVPLSEFKALTKIPIIIFYGDNIPDAPSENPATEQWRVFLDAAQRWAAVVNRHGGDVKVVHLPEIGIKGNTHFPFSDLNNLEIADQLSKFLTEKNLDQR